MTQVHIKMIRDEEDGTPVFEVDNGEGVATNAVTLDDALEFARTLLTPSIDHKAIARDWMTRHGNFVYEGISDDIATEAEDELGVQFLSEDDLDTILNLIETAKVIIEF